jgi:hypothetical protein
MVDRVKQTDRNTNTNTYGQTERTSIESERGMSRERVFLFEK